MQLPKDFSQDGHSIILALRISAVLSSLIALIVFAWATQAHKSVYTDFNGSSMCLIVMITASDRRWSPALIHLLTLGRLPLGGLCFCLVYGRIDRTTTVQSTPACGHIPCPGLPRIWRRGGFDHLLAGDVGAIRNGLPVRQGPVRGERRPGAGVWGRHCPFGWGAAFGAVCLGVLGVSSIDEEDAGAEEGGRALISFVRVFLLQLALG
ncbi:uncharacterized protein KD926_011141 [Aspergillus affinis]|uniref:uncharacterized protein n=1 Tax=Aspergillus affinis TaxID=1070780 RepID=UPI0022FDD6C9|nr:uncharacterized protein KD926_011141 [Aspergillus affinis]KAI9038202.1 hypothetical protein KD926_011141 [Aspergillus affinis]